MEAVCPALYGAVPGSVCIRWPVQQTDKPGQALAVAVFLLSVADGICGACGSDNDFMVSDAELLSGWRSGPAVFFRGGYPAVDLAGVPADGDAEKKRKGSPCAETAEQPAKRERRSNTAKHRLSAERMNDARSIDNRT